MVKVLAALVRLEDSGRRAAGRAVRAVSVPREVPADSDKGADSADSAAVSGE
jgi:hypothetical protein